MVRIYRLCGDGRADFCRGCWCIGVSRRSRQRNCEAIYSRVDRVNSGGSANSGGIPCVTGCKATSGAVTTQSLRSRQTEGLSDKKLSLWCCMERMRTSIHIHAQELHFPRIFHGESATPSYAHAKKLIFP